jgi:beta-N-acetylhexosaminidase
MRGILAVLLIIFSLKSTAQINLSSTENNSARTWADSVYNTLSNDERIAQLMVVRLSTYDFKNKKAVYFDENVSALVKQYNIGGICVFQ